ncbi:MAG: hypothetical protein ACKVQS_07305 [Fimbriimonadaceae bacterium]
MAVEIDFRSLARWKNYQILLAVSGLGWTVPGFLYTQSSFDGRGIGVVFILVWLCFVVITLQVWLKFLSIYKLVNQVPVGEWVGLVSGEEVARWVREMLFRRLKRGGDGWTELMLVSYWDLESGTLIDEYRSAFEKLGRLILEGKKEAARSFWKGVVYSLPAVAAFLIVWAYIAWAGWQGVNWNLDLLKWLLGIVALYPVLLAFTLRKNVSVVTLARREIFRGLPDDVLALTWGVQPLGLGAATVIHERYGGDQALVREKMAEANVHLKRWGNRDYL